MTPTPDQPTRRFPRLRRALGVFLDRADGAATPGDADLLARHPELREHLEPMLAGLVAGPESGAGEHQLGDFRLVRELGRGGMGVVYEALQLSLNRRVAIKVLPAHLTLLPTAIARFRREAQTAAQLDHPGIVKILGVGSTGDAHWFAMELVAGAPLDRVLDALRAAGKAAPDGEDLRAALRHGGASPADAVAAPTGGYLQAVARIGVQVAEALHHAHGAGIVHRDIKPSNILLRADGSAVVTDFGLARESGLPAMTVDGAFAGTPHYVSPEQAEGRTRDVGPASDVFSLGVTLYELLTLKRPFAGDSTPVVLAAILRQEPTDPQRLSPRLLPDLAAIVLKALEKSPAQRYATAADLAQDLQAFLECRPVTARRATALLRMARWARREPLKAALVVLLALAIPLVTALSGYALAQRELAREGQRRRELDQVEQGLCASFQALADGQLAEAERSFAALITARPGLVEARAGAALTAAALGQHETALRLLTVDRPPGGEALRYLEAPTLRTLGRTDQAKAIERELPPPVGAAELFLAGLVEFAWGDTLQLAREQRRAYGLLHQAVLQSPRARPLYHQMLAEVAADAGPEAARECADALIALWPQSPMTLTTVASCLSRTNDLTLVARARAAAEQALALDPTAARTRRLLGITALFLGDLARARAELAAVVAQDPGDAAAHSALARVQRQAGDLAGALAAAQRAVDLRPGRPGFRYELAATLVAASRPAEAMKEAQLALQVNPDHARALQLLATLQARAGDVESAERNLRRAVAAEPRAARGWFLLAQFHQDAGRIKDAIEDYRAGLQCEPRDQGGLNNLAGLLWKDRQQRAAIATMRQVVALHPLVAASHNNLVKMLNAVGDTAEAEAEVARFARASAAAPESPASAPASGR